MKTCERAATEGLPIFLFGGSEQLQKALREKLLERIPKLQIAGGQASKFRQLEPEERDQTVAHIRASGAAITFVGLGCPRQEVWAYELRDSLSMPILAVGAAFNFHAGLLRQAPRWMQMAGLEWSYRLVAEPSRLWRRYLLLNPLFASMLVLQAIRPGTFHPGHTVEPKQEFLYG